MPTYLEIVEERHFISHLVGSLRDAFQGKGFELANHTRWEDGEVFEFRRDDQIVSLLVETEELETQRVKIESEQEVKAVWDVLEQGLVKLFSDMVERIFRAHHGDHQQLARDLVQQIERLAGG